MSEPASFFRSETETTRNHAPTFGVHEDEPEIETTTSTEERHRGIPPTAYLIGGLLAIVLLIGLISVGANWIVNGSTVSQGDLENQLQNYVTVDRANAIDARMNQNILATQHAVDKVNARVGGVVHETARMFADRDDRIGASEKRIGEVAVELRKMRGRIGVRPKVGANEALDMFNKGVNAPQIHQFLITASAAHLINDRVQPELKAAEARAEREARVNARASEAAHERADRANERMLKLQELAAELEGGGDSGQ